VYDAMLTIGGYVGTDVQFSEGNGGGARAMFRVGSTPRWFDRSSGSWRDQETVWLTVKAWRELAHNVKASVRKGEPVIVTGRLRASKWKDGAGEERTEVVVDAVAVGHDLNRGTTAYRRSLRQVRREDDVDDNELMRRLDAGPAAEAGTQPGAPGPGLTT
jgi:single-strand DNA-binding protein